MAPAPSTALGGEVVRLRSRDGLRLTGRWLPGRRARGGARRASQRARRAATGSPDPREADPAAPRLDSGSVTPDLVELGAVPAPDGERPRASTSAATAARTTRRRRSACARSRTSPGALAWLGERGIRRVALVGSSMGGIIALAVRRGARATGGWRRRTSDPDAPAAERRRAAAPDRGGRRGVRAAGARRRRREPDARPVRAADRGPGLRADGADGRRGPARDPADRRRRPAGGRAAAARPRATPTATVPLRDARRLAAAAPEGTRRLVSTAPTTARGHAADPVAYEAAVTDRILREAFAMTRSERGHGLTRPYTGRPRRRRGSGVRARQPSGDRSGRVGWRARSSSSMTTRACSGCSSSPSSRRGTRSSSPRTAPTGLRQWQQESPSLILLDATRHGRSTATRSRRGSAPRKAPAATSRSSC